MPVAKDTFAREQLDSSQMERLQLELQRLRRILVDCPFVDGTEVPSVAIGTTVTAVAHRRGRSPNGWLVLKLSTPAKIGLSATQATDPSKFINLEADVAVTATLWFF